MVLPKEEKDVDPKKERDMEDHKPTIDLISRINNVQVSSNYPISAFVNFFDILIYFQSGFIGKKRGGATAYRLGRTKRGSTTGGKGIKQKCTSFLRQSLFFLSLSGHGDGEEVWWGKTEVPAEDKVSSSSLLLDIMDVQSYFCRSNLHMGKSKESSEEKEEVGESGGTAEERNGRAKYENCKSVVNDDEQFRTNR